MSGNSANSGRQLGESRRPCVVVTDGCAKTGDEGKVQIVGMKMQDVEFERRSTNFLELLHVVRQRVVHLRQPERLRSASNQFRGGFRIAAGEERHLMSLPHQFLGQIGNDPFSSAIELRRNTFHQWRNLGDFHPGTPFGVRRSPGRNPRSAVEVPFRPTFARAPPFVSRLQQSLSAKIWRGRTSPARPAHLVVLPRAERRPYCGSGPSSGQPSAVHEIGENWSLEAPNASPS